MRQLKITKQITNRDSISFNNYLTEVGNIGDVITSKEEIELARRIKEGDIDARNKLVKANLRFVISVAKQYHGKAPLSDLVNEGNIGLIKAAERFDETRGFKFISYAVWWIRQSIMQHISENGKKIRLPLNKISTINKVYRATSELEQSLERGPTYEEISEFLMKSEINSASGDTSKYEAHKIKALIEQSQNISSLDAPMTNESDAGTMYDLIEGEDEHDVNKTIKNSDLEIELKKAMSKLTFREKDVITLYFGLFGQRQRSLEEIGGKLDLTRERVRQIKEKSVRKLKHRAHLTPLKEYVY